MMADLIDRQAAIKAIENLQDCYNGFSDTYDKACIIGVIEEIPTAQVNTPTDTPTDTISRQAAIEEIARWIGYIDEDMVLRIQTGLKKVPSAQRTGRWIPVSERLPNPNEKENDCLVYYLVQNEYGDMMVAAYRGNTNGEIWWEQMYAYKPIKDEVIAWMPLPEPYKGGEQDECNGNLYSNSDHVFFNRRACWGSSWQGRKEKIMDDLISRQAAIEEAKPLFKSLNNYGYMMGVGYNHAVADCIAILNNLPSAQPERCEDCRNFNNARLLIPQPERKKGKWIIVTDSRGKHAECQYCGEWKYHSKQKFCGECGARMEEADERT